MPLFQPSNITPSTFAGVGGGTVAVEDNVKITWQVNGNVPMTAFKIDFYLETMLVYTTGIVELIEAFYPTDNRGNPNFYEFGAFGKTWAELGLTNGNQYTMNITQYWGGLTDEKHSVSQFSQSAFITREKPTIKITDTSGEELPSTIYSVAKDISATYNQAQNDSIDWVRWRTYRVDGNKNILTEDTGIVNTSQLLFTLDNLVNGNVYLIQCTIQTSNGVIVEQTKSINVSYELPEIDGNFDVSAYDLSSNLLEWSAFKPTGDNINGRSSTSPIAFENGKLVLDNNEWAKWDNINGEPMLINPNYSIAMSTSIEVINELKKTNEYIVGSAYLAVSKNGLVVSGKDIFKDGNKIGEVSFINSNLDVDTITHGVFVDMDYYGSTAECFIACVKTNSIKNPYKILIFRVESNNIIFLGQLADRDGDAFVCVTDMYRGNWGNAPKAVWIINKKYISSIAGLGVVLTSKGFEIADGISFYGASVGGNSVASYGRHFVVGGRNGDYKLYYASSTSMSTGTVLALAYESIIVPNNNDLSEDEGCAAVCQNSNGGYTIALNYSLIETYSKTSKQIFNEIKADGFFVTCATFHKDGEFLLAGSSGGYIYVYKKDGANYLFSHKFLTQESTQVKDINIYNDEALYIISGESLQRYTNEAIEDAELFSVETNNGIIFSLYLENNSINACFGESKVSKSISTAAISKALEKEYATIKLKTALDNYYVYLSVNGEILHKSISYEMKPIISVEIKNEQICDWVGIMNFGTIDITNFTPTWNEYTVFLTNFNRKTLQAGRISVDEATTEIYREDLSSGELKKVISSSAEITSLRDFSWVNGKRYRYVAYVKLGGKYAGMHIFNPDLVIRNQYGFTLIEAKKDKSQPDVFHVVKYWIFSNNISSSSVTNNNEPNFLKNFTPYRLKQSSSRAGESGTLSALLSNARMGKYNDTKEQMEELEQISYSENTFFLKDLKGNIYMCTVSAPITHSINNATRELETSISIPWEEIGSAENISIIQTELDENWKEQQRN